MHKPSPCTFLWRKQARSKLRFRLIRFFFVSFANPHAHHDIDSCIDSHAAENCGAWNKNKFVVAIPGTGCCYVQMPKFTLCTLWLCKITLSSPSLAHFLLPAIIIFIVAISKWNNVMTNYCNYKASVMKNIQQLRTSLKDTAKSYRKTDETNGKTMLFRSTLYRCAGKRRQRKRERTV